MAYRYSTIKQLKSEEGKRYYLNPIYPEIPLSEDDYYVMSTYTDRYDTLALEYYNDSSLWWVIASANPKYPPLLTIPPGVQIRIPANPQIIERDFVNFNSDR